MSRLKKYAIIFLAVLALASCSPKCELPNGNVKDLNTQENELAPSAVPKAQFENICGREFQTQASKPTFGVIPAKRALNNVLPSNLIDRVEGVVYYDKGKGFFSIAHPPDSASAFIKRLSFSGGAGGADIIEFNRDILTALPEPINTATWDSHPFAAEENGALLLIWSSDRAASKGGFSSPFLKLTSDGNDTLIGNTDLFYSFRKKGTWSEVKNLTVNTKFNEESPFVFCMCHNSSLLFSSNRNNNDINDYDIYEVFVDIDFENLAIEVKGEPIRLPKGEQLINTEAKEYFPFIPYPYPDSDNPKPYLFFSSDRYSKTPCGTGDIIKNMGAFDIYRFPFTRSCRAPKINYRLTLLNEESPVSAIPLPYLELKDSKGALLERKMESSATFELDFGKSYTFYGGSAYDTIECTGARSVISHYAKKNIFPGKPLIAERDSLLTFDSLISGRTIYNYDTLNYVSKLHKDDISKINTLIKPESKIENISTAGDSLIINIREIKTIAEKIEGKSIKKQKILKLYDTVARFDTSYSRSSQKGIPSSLTSRNKPISFAPVQDTIIYDTVYLTPRYFTFPPCNIVFNDHLDLMRKNIPYFQTGFWEVNTRENLKKHLAELPENIYKGASFIELHPQNQYFGYLRGNLSEEQQNARRNKREARIAEYQKFAAAVDMNLDALANEILDSLLPQIKELDIPSSKDSFNLKMPMNNKLLIRIEGWSDIRPVEKGWYTGSEAINYVSGEYIEENSQLKLEDIHIRSEVSLVGESNDTLSKLRAYFGYEEIFSRLMENPQFRVYFNSGRILSPDNSENADDFRRKFSNARLVFLVLGKQVDSSPGIEPSELREKDFRALDPVRRINIIISRIKYSDGKLLKADCCAD